MTIRELKLGPCLLQSLHEDELALISRLLSPSDLCNLSLCCKSLRDLVDSDTIWLVQCELLKVIPFSEIAQWRIGISSYKTLCRFLFEVMNPLVGIWSHHRPFPGNVVYVMPGFLSVVGCRIIPQKVGPLGIQEGRVSWSPVFEIICGFDGSPEFFLHGRDGGGSCLYPGFVTGIEKGCNTLLLEVEPREEKKVRSETTSGKVLMGEDMEDVPFCKLSIYYRRNFLALVTSHVVVHVTEPLVGKLFPTPKDDEAMLLERRTMLLKMRKFGRNWKLEEEDDDAQLSSNPMLVDIKELWEDEVDGTDTQNFLSSSDRFGLTLKASYTKVSSYDGWPYMYRDVFVLYKLPLKVAAANEEYAGLWGGTFGWPPVTEDEPKKVFYLLMLTYDHSVEDSDVRLLIGTKILDGTDYVKSPNGKEMFIVKIDSPFLEPFPFDADGRDFKHSYTGVGTEKDSEYRYASKVPGSLFVISDDHIAFVWQETKKVITLQRLNLEEMLKKGLGLCVPPLPPNMNFTYLQSSCTNVYTEPLHSYSSD